MIKIECPLVYGMYDLVLGPYSKQWKKVKFLVDHGFNFQKVYRKGGAVWSRERYPQNLEQAKEFVIKFKGQAFDFGWWVLLKRVLVNPNPDARKTCHPECSQRIS